MELKKLMEHISIIPDYRQAWKVEHKLSDILLLTICAVISGAEGWEDIEDFGETHLDFLKQYGDFENGIPDHDTIARVVSCISPAKFHECFINWMRDCHSTDDKDVIAIDGKTLRHSYDKSRRRGAIHVISAFSTMHSLVIGQIKTDEKSNEITAIPELLNMLDINLPELYPVSVLQNFTSALLTGCVTAILQMIKTSLQLMEKRSGTLMTRVAAGERFMSLVRSQQCTVWSSDRSRRMRNLMRLQLSQNFLTCWILMEKSSQLMRWVARKILQRRYKNREVIIYSR